MNQMKQPNPNKSRALRVAALLGGVLAVAVAVMIVVLCLPQREQEFVPPAFDADALPGVPENVDERLMYQELYQEGMAYRISVCWVPAAEGKSLTVYFTNAADNEKYLKLRVLDEAGNILGETGLLKPGEYVKSVRLERKLAPGTKIRLTAMGYEPDTYESAGAFHMNFTVQ